MPAPYEARFGEVPKEIPDAHPRGARLGAGVLRAIGRDQRRDRGVLEEACHHAAVFGHFDVSGVTPAYDRLTKWVPVPMSAIENFPPTSQSSFPSWPSR